MAEKHHCAAAHDIETRPNIARETSATLLSDVLRAVPDMLATIHSRLADLEITGQRLCARVNLVTRALDGHHVIHSMLAATSRCFAVCDLGTRSR